MTIQSTRWVAKVWFVKFIVKIIIQEFFGWTYIVFTTGLKALKLDVFNADEFGEGHIISVSLETGLRLSLQ